MSAPSLAARAVSLCRKRRDEMLGHDLPSTVPTACALCIADAVVEAGNRGHVLTCVYCGHEYEPGTPTHGAAVLTAHIRVCEKHPMRAVVVELEVARRERDAIALAAKADASIIRERDSLMRDLAEATRDAARFQDALHALLVLFADTPSVPEAIDVTVVEALCPGHEQMDEAVDRGTLGVQHFVSDPNDEDGGRWKDCGLDPRVDRYRDTSMPVVSKITEEGSRGHHGNDPTAADAASGDAQPGGMPAGREGPSASRGPALATGGRGQHSRVCGCVFGDPGTHPDCPVHGASA